MLKGLLTVLFTALVIFLPAQEYYEGKKVIKHRLDNEVLDNDLAGISIFRTLGIENNLNVDDLKVEANIQVSYKVKRDKSYTLSLWVVADVLDLTGNINLKDFIIDTLLYPTNISIDFNVFNGRHYVGDKSVALKGFGNVNNFDLSDFNNNIGEIKIEPSKLKLIYTESDLQRFQETVELIKQYYSYNSLLEHFNAIYDQYSLVSGESTEKISLHRIQVEIIKAYIDKLGKFSSLGIDYRDPLRFKEKYEQFNRFYNRYVTLFDELLSSEAGFENHFLFCNDMVSSNNSLLKHSEKVQPAEAIAFKEITTLPDDIELESVLSTIVYKYDIGKTDAGQCIIDKYINTGLDWKKKNHLSFALVNLNNAFTIAKWLNKELSLNYYNLYQQVMSGLVSSYLKVGNMAIVNGKVDYGLTYVNKGINLLQTNISAFQEIQSMNDAFIELLDLNNKTAISLLDEGYFDDAYRINELNRNLCAGKNAFVCLTSDSVYNVISQSFLKEKIYETYKLIEDGQFPDAIMVYNQIIDSSYHLNDDSDELDNIKSLANFLSDTIFFQSNVLLKARQSEMALEKLLLAANILNRAGLQSESINTTLITVSEQAIIEILSKAKFSIWKNELDIANEQIKVAKELSYTYLGNKSVIVNNKFNEIEQYLGTRVCVDISNSYNDAIKKITLSIRDKSYHNIMDLVTTARTYLKSYKQCDLDSTLINSLELRNGKLFDYLSIYESIKNALINHRYGIVIENYMKLTEYYNNNYQKLSDVKYYDLHEFLEMQNLYSLTIEAVKYYLDIEEPDNALAYLKMAMKQGVNQNDDKDVIEQLTAQLARNDRNNNISVNTALDNYTDNMEQKSFFRLSYIRNRYFKNQKN